MKARLKRILSIALTLSLIWGMFGGIAPVKAHADPTIVSRTVSVELGGTATEEINIGNTEEIHTVNPPNWVTFSRPNGNTMVVTIAPDAGVQSGPYTATYYTTVESAGDPTAHVREITINITVTNEVHTYNNGVCTLCGNECPHTNVSGWFDNGNTHSGTCDECGQAVSHAADWSGWEPYQNGNHIHNCRQCELTETAAHTYVNGVCTGCNAEEPAQQQPSQPSQPEPEPEPERDSYTGPIASYGDPIGSSSDDNIQVLDVSNVTPPEVVNARNKILSLRSEINNLAGSSNQNTRYSEIRASGLTLEMGNNYSFDKNTYINIYALVNWGVPVNIKYRYKGYENSLTIPAGFPVALADLCDKEGYLGFEKLRGILLYYQTLLKDPSYANNKEAMREKILAYDNILAVATGKVSTTTPAGSATAAASATTATAGQNTASIALSDKNIGIFSADDIQYSSKVVSMLVATPFGGELIIDVTRGVPYLDETIISTMVIRSDTSVTFNFFDGRKTMGIRIPSGSDLKALKEKVAIEGKISLISLVGQYN